MFNNYGVGSEVVGFGLPGTDCNSTNTFVDNVVGSIGNGGILFNGADNKCYKMGGVGAYHVNNKAIFANVASHKHELFVDKIISAENNINMVTRTGTGNNIHNTITITNLFISALARESYTVNLRYFL